MNCQDFARNQTVFDDERLAQTLFVVPCRTPLDKKEPKASTHPQCAMVIPQNDKAKLGARLWQTTPAKGNTTIPMRTQSSQETDHTDCPKRSEFPLSQPSDCPKSWRNTLALRTVPGVTECPIKAFGGYRELLDRPTCSSVKHKEVRRTVPGVTDGPMDQRIALALRTVEGPRKKGVSVDRGILVPLLLVAEHVSTPGVLAKPWR